MPIPKTLVSENQIHINNHLANELIPFPQRAVDPNFNLHPSESQLGADRISFVPLIGPPREQRLLDKQRVGSALRIVPHAHLNALRTRRTPRRTVPLLSVVPASASLGAEGIGRGGMVMLADEQEEDGDHNMSDNHSQPSKSSMRSATTDNVPVPIVENASAAVLQAAQ